MKIIFFGTPPFAATILDYLITKGVNVAAIVTKPDKPKGRSGAPAPSAVKLLVEQKYPHISLHQPPIVSAQTEADTLASYHADLFVVVAYGEIIKQHLLDMPQLGCINVHPSLLPKYRGAAPVQQAIIHGEAETGVTIMHMSKKMDAGDIIKAVCLPIDPNATFGELEDKLCALGAKVLLEVIHAIEKGEAARTPQDHDAVTFAPKIELEDCRIDWSRPAQVIHDLVRGVNPYPGAWCQTSVKGISKRLKVWRTKVVPDLQGTPGSVLKRSKNELIVACGKGAVQLLLLQLEGKKMMKAEELLCGIPSDALTFMVEV